MLVATCAMCVVGYVVGRPDVIVLAGIPAVLCVAARVGCELALRKAVR